LVDDAAFESGFEVFEFNAGQGRLLRDESVGLVLALGKLEEEK
jgi:hypothetical protein